MATTVVQANETCEVECYGSTIVITPRINLGEMNFDRFVEVAEDVIRHLDRGERCNVVIDLQETDYFGSQTVGMFVQLWRATERAGGGFGLCGVSNHELVVLNVSKLDALWAIYPRREDAVRAIGGLAEGD